MKTRKRLRTPWPLNALLLPAGLCMVGCQLPITPIASTLTGTGNTTFTPSSPASTSLVGASGTPNLLGGNPTSPSPAASLPAPAASQAQVSALQTKYSVKIGGSCANQDSLGALEKGLGFYQQAARFKDLSFDLPCAQQQSYDGLWEGDEATGYKISLYVFTGEKVYTHTVAHELAHHITLAKQNESIGTQLRPLIGTTPEFHPSEYGKTHPDEQLAEVVSYCREELYGGSDAPPDTAGWRCPDRVKPVTSTL